LILSFKVCLAGSRSPALPRKGQLETVVLQLARKHRVSSGTGVKQHLPSTWMQLSKIYSQSVSWP